MAAAAPVPMRQASLVYLIAALSAPSAANAQVEAPTQVSASASRASLVAFDALERWENAVASNTQSPDEWHAVGQALYDARRYREAVAAFERGLTLRANGSSDDAWSIARAYAQLGNRKQALRWLTHAQQLGFKDELAVGREPAFDKFRGEIRFREVVRSSVCHECRSRSSMVRTLI